MFRTPVFLIIEIVEELVVLLVLLQIDISDPLLIIQVPCQLKFDVDLVVLVLYFAEFFEVDPISFHDLEELVLPKD